MTVCLPERKNLNLDDSGRSACRACSTENTDVSTGTPRRFSARNSCVIFGMARPISTSSSAWEKTSAGVPFMTFCPWFMTSSRSTFDAISSIEWLTITTAACCAA